MDRYNLYTFSVMRAILHRHDEFKQRSEDLNEALMMTPGMAPFLEEYHSVLKGYFMRKHYFLHFAVKTGLAMGSAKTRLNTSLERLVAYFMVNPKTSSYDEYMNSGPPLAAC